MRTESPTIRPSRHEVGAFPIVHDDELLYSIVTRFGLLSGYLDADSANLDLFGHAFGYAATALPSNLDEMALHLPTSLDLTGRDLALRHTLLPFHTAFLTQAAVEGAIIKACANPGRENLAPTRTVERPLTRPLNLRFCPECLRDMQRSDRDLHSKRVHQLAIVTLCPEHECDLRETGIVAGVGDRQLHPASLDVCGRDLPPVIPDGAAGSCPSTWCNFGCGPGPHRSGGLGCNL